jgi:hypothetical protein
MVFLQNEKTEKNPSKLLIWHETRDWGDLEDEDKKDNE